MWPSSRRRRVSEVDRDPSELTQARARCHAQLLTDVLFSAEHKRERLVSSTILHK